MGEVDNYTKKGLPNHQNINKYAVNGAIHYATAIINGTESYKEVIAIGITGWGDPKKIETALKVYYVSDENYNVPKQVGEYEDLSFLSDSELPDFIEKIDSLYLTEEEREMLTQKLETQIETNLKKLNQEMRDTYSIKYEQGVDKDEDFPADVFLLNPPYSEKGKGFNFVKLALSRMKGGRAAVLIQENAGGGEGGSFSRDILENNTLVASIKMGNIFCGRSNVQTAIYVFDVSHAHPEKKKVKFIDFTNDGYSRQNRKKSNQEVNLRDVDDAIGRYKEIVDIVLDCEPETNYYTLENTLLITDTITTKTALKEPQKALDKVHEKIDPLRKNLNSIENDLKDIAKRVKSAKDEQKKALEKEQKEKSNKADKLKKKIQAIEPELIAAQNKYNDIYNKIGADWTYNQHKQIDTRPSEEEFKKVISNYLSWKINEILKNE